MISHPHYYTTHVDWARTFGCPVFVAREDEGWICRRDGEDVRRFVEEGTEEVLEGVVAINVRDGCFGFWAELICVCLQTGGHFPGSLVLNWDKKLFIADSLVTVPVSTNSEVMEAFNTDALIQSALYHVDRPPGTTSFAFMWSIPNMIPLPPSELLKMWHALRPFEFECTFGAFVGTEVRDKNVKARVLESMKIQARNEGWTDVAILKETL